MFWIRNLQILLGLVVLTIMAYYGYHYLKLAGQVGAGVLLAYGYFLALRFWRLVPDVLGTKDMVVYTLSFLLLSVGAFYETGEVLSFAVLLGVYPATLMKQLYFRLRPYLEEVRV